MVVAGSMLAIFAASAGAVAPVESYTLVGKGGGTMHASYYRSESHFILDIHFTKAAVSATERQPQAGECAWLDRRFRTDEPGYLVLSIGTNSQVSLNIDSGGAHIQRFFGDRRTDVEYLVNAIMGGQAFYVRVHKSSDGSSFLIDRIGP